MLHASLIKLFVQCSNHNKIFDSKDKDVYFYEVKENKWNLYLQYYYKIIYI